MILAFGCSIAHGCELVHPYQHEENTLLSYPQLVADHLGTSCINYSLCGISNEGIFHLLQEKVAQYKDVDTIIVGWTASMREYWRANGRHWFVIPSWTATLEDAGSKPTHVKDYSEKGVKESSDKGIDINDNPRIVTDDEQYLDELETNYKFTIKNKFDDYEYQLKKKHYINNVRMYATVNNIKLIETANLEPIDDVAIYTDTIGQWRDIRIAHPNKLEHEIIAKQIIEQYYGR
jgi:hypothetical protein